MRFKGFQRSYTVHLNVSPFGNLPHIAMGGRPGASNLMVKSQSRSVGLKAAHDFRASRSVFDGSRRATFHSSNMERVSNVFNHGSPVGCIRLSLFSSPASPKRCLSHVPKVMSSKDNVCVTVSTHPFKYFRNNWKQSKSLAAHGEKTTATSNVSTIVDVMGEGKLDGNDKEDADKNPTVKVKQQGRKKKNKENQAKSTASNVTLPSTSKIGHLTEASEKIKTDTGPVEVNGRPKSINKKSKTTAKKSSLQVQSNEACIDTGTTPSNVGETKGQNERKMKQLFPPTGKSVVVVESVTKAKVIQHYLGDMFEVLPSYGHVRDLAGRSGSVRPDDDFSMVWEVPSAAWTHIKSMKIALNGAENLILASDPDREGEAIAWHILEMLRQQDALRKDVVVSRVVFHEITEKSIKAALQTPREIDANLVDAYLARRALDYLIGFNISPLLWRKLPSCSSAGRVQSAALSLICDREMEIDQFHSKEYWSIEAFFGKDRDSLNSACSISAHLTHFASKKLNQFSINSDTVAKDIEQKINTSEFVVVGSKKSKMRKNPPTPYITSTLQQDAAAKLGFSATYTMKLAQKLYEGIELSGGQVAGLITYTRTDGLHISNEAMKDIRSLIIDRYGEDFLSDSARKFFKKVKNAQEAHEAIRPTDIRRLPRSFVGLLDDDSSKLYALIWSRTMACQMELATIDQIQLDISTNRKDISFRSTCSKVGFLGYQAAYKDVEEAAFRNEGCDRDEMYKCLDSFKSGDAVSIGKVEIKQHHTNPPPRYSEGTLVKKLEELGIGRPSTYAVTLRVLQDRKYVTTKSRVLHPEFRGRMLSAFLANHFSEVTDYGFTANMESELDNVSAGTTEWKGLLKDYWTRFSSNCTRVSTVHIHEVEKMLEKTFGNFLFASLPDKSRTCPSCKDGTLCFKVSRFGAGYFIGCDQHPKCKYIAKTLYGNEDDDDTPQSNIIVEEPKLLGTGPGSSEKILLKNGPYGFYVQLGEDRKGYLPKRASVSQIKDVNSITLEDALELLRYPLTLGNHPDDKKPVIIKLAKAGFSIRHRRNSVDVPKSMKANEVTLEKALKLLLSKDVKQSGRPKNKPKAEVYETL